jgi:hypothetical protein
MDKNAGKITDEYMGIKEVGEELGWTRSKVSVYKTRGILPDPAFIVGKRPFWNARDIKTFKQVYDGKIG